MRSGKEIVPMALPGERDAFPETATPSTDSRETFLPSSGNGQRGPLSEKRVVPAPAVEESKTKAAEPRTRASEMEATAVETGASATPADLPSLAETSWDSKVIALGEEKVTGPVDLPSPVNLASKIDPTPINHLEQNTKADGTSAQQSKNGMIQIRPNPNAPLVINRHDVIAQEAFGILRSRLLKAHETGIQAILITSSEQGEGKTVVAINAALSLAQLEQKQILLVDADMRAGGVTEFLGLEARAGLSNCLREEKSIEAVIHATNFPFLSVVPAGQTPEGVLPEALEGSRWPEFLQRVKEQFDLIIVDALPISAPVIDLELLLSPCDAYLVTVQIGKTPRSSMERLAQWIDRQKFLGVIVNNADKLNDGSYHYGYYGSKNKK
jgi:protein-tyrosine kinase